jgi:hypothetical protein
MARDPKKAQSRSRAKYKCPERLAELIEIDRSLPAGFELPDLRDIQLQFARQQPDPIKWFAGKPRLSLTTAEIRIVKRNEEKIYGECFRPFPKQVVKKILIDNYRGGYKSPFLQVRKDARETAKRWAVNRWYPEYMEFRRLLSAIADFFEYARTQKPYVNERGEVIADSRSPKPPSTFVYIASYGTKKLDPRSSKLINTLFVDNGDRIRKCQFCRLIYWAVRDDSRTCTRRCANALRQRDYRNLSDEEKMARKESRASDRVQNLKLKKLREAKNRVNNDQQN